MQCITKTLILRKAEEIVILSAESNLSRARDWCRRLAHSWK